MKKYQLQDYEIYVSERLHSVYDGQDQLLIIYPEHTSICCSVTVSQDGNLQLATYWGVVYDVCDKVVRIWYSNEEVVR
ncbi:hypothetical protein ABPH35_00740 [Streptococcus sp. ZJ93]|uniref:hypothetical protein n=1 Tax=Streptococcus handemini TaxID=3161188 RepID=UPI0032EE6D50